MPKTYLEVEPSLVGEAANAWELYVDNEKDGAAVSHWLIQSPHFHPMWDRWLLVVVHLRELGGDARPAQQQYDEATHEFLIISIDPDQEPFDPGAPPRPIKHLQPLDAAVQFHLDSDADAHKLCEMAAQAVCAGGISPDSDYRAGWESLIKNTAAHLRGEHGEPKDPLH